MSRSAVAGEARAAVGRGPIAAAATVTQQAPHLHSIDLLRLLTFACVVGVHAVPMPTSPDSVVAGGVVAVLHFTRYTFFLLSAFVLFHVYYRRDFRLRDFWGRRFFYVGIPYVVWSVIYWALNDRRITALGPELLFGTAEYHMYFLLVSMQLYLVFPLLRALLRRTAGHHVLLFAASLGVQVAFLWAILWRPWPGGALGQYQIHAYALLPTYQFFFLAGGLAAVHFERFHRLVDRHRRAVGVLVLAGLAFQEVSYVIHLLRTGSALRASDPLQPSMVVWSVAVTVGFYALGCLYAERRRAGRLAHFLDLASTVSFGVYLMHPLILNVVLQRWLNYPSPIPVAAAVLIAWLVPLAVSFAVMALVVRTPFALPLTGRRRATAAR